MAAARVGRCCAALIPVKRRCWGRAVDQAPVSGLRRSMIVGRNSVTVGWAGRMRPDMGRFLVIQAFVGAPLCLAQLRAPLERATLEAYQTHPVHLALKAVVAPLRSARSQLDFERASPLCGVAAQEGKS